MALGFASASSQKLTTTGLAPTGDLVVEAWIYPTDISANQNWIWMIGNASAEYIAYTIGAGGNNDRFVAETNKGGTVDVIGNAAITTGQWYYVRFTRKSSDGAITVKSWNGADLSAHSTGSGTGGTGAFNFEVGATVQIGLNIAGNSSYFNGRLRNFLFITSGIPTDAESLARALDTNPIGTGPTVNTVSNFWPLADSGDTRDFMQSKTLTMVNTPTTTDDAPAQHRRF